MKTINKWLSSLALLLASCVALAAGEPMLVVGHKNPDTDAIISAIAVADLKAKMGVAAVPIAQGLPNPETRFVLETFQLKAPAVQTSVAGREVFLIDHSDYPLAPDDLKKAEVVGLVDHHKLGGITTDKPIEVWVFPVGSSGTIITRMYDAAGVPIPKAIAGGMASAILSDTQILKSPTTTPEDRVTVTRLAKLAGIEDVQAYGMKMFEAGNAELKSAPAKDLLQRDFKAFVMNGKKVGVAQLEAVSLAMLTPRKDELLKAMADLKGQGYQSVFLMLTDIMQGGSDFLFLPDDAAIVESALGVKAQGSSVWIPGLVSRKKQVIPGLEKAFR
ncbi:DHH family phosphoesterase [Candidatus Skiveiella danica]|jgi:manganese-dependent inorganic pyrophosphatase|uniref:manganese-dependent inorganic pyrophosphatase n=1 Tax=Candidatus Skiveiella danica TaxID=3386177 RepID=UPI0009C87632|nr:MAG: putative manganese-dependent inorganic pyrophosphatase [Alphaproteobacteria bacterium ADurb.Bin100]HPL79939.1 manganese-dependent inorganic pyrophosphatase [Burkholderiaceae bacterium]